MASKIKKIIIHSNNIHELKWPWKRQRAVRKIEKILIERGNEMPVAKRLAKNILEMAIGNPQE